MSGLYFPDVELPENGEFRVILFSNGKLARCNGRNVRMIPVPDHGRLVDADALMVEYEKAENSSDQHGREFSYSFRSGGELCTEWWPMHLMLRDAPTIIPADKDGA